jgi:DNA-binding HxlR family transcriptional regulator
VERSRGYGEGCAVAHGLDLIGERWALLIVRELLLGPKRFNALQAGMRNASANIVSLRLQQMQQVGIVRRRRLGAPAHAWVWELTDWGYELEPIVMAIGLWARHSPVLEPDGWFSPDALLLHLKARLDNEVAPPSGRYRLLLGDEWYSIIVDQTRASVSVGRRELDEPDATVESDLATLTAVVMGRERFDDAVNDARLVTRGDPTAIRRLLTGHNS